MLCLSTQIFNNIKVFNLFKKVDMSKILNMGQPPHVEKYEVEMQWVPFLANCVKSEHV